MKIRDVVQFLEKLAPPPYQESYDNSGLITGNPADELKGILISLDCIESIVEEAIEKGCNMIVAHHPIVFRGLKSLTGRNYVERTVIKAIKNDIAIYAIHTNLDNVNLGVNKKICDKIGLENYRVLSPKNGTLKKLFTYIPKENFEAVREALFAAGAGHIGEYSKCSFAYEGTGSFMGSDESNPTIGEKEDFTELNEMKLEVLFPSVIERQVLGALKTAHPYEEVAYELINLDNQNQDVGAGMIGELPEAMSATDFLEHLKKTFKCGCIRHTALPGKPVKTIAVCGGAGQFLLSTAKRQGADVFVSGDFKYHEFFDADNQILIADIGHYESEQYTSNLLYEYLSDKFPNFAVLITAINTNPVKYYS